MTKNTVVLAPLTQMGHTLKQHLNYGSITRFSFLYSGIFMGLVRYEKYMIVFVSLVVLEAMIYYMLYIKLYKERKPRYFVYLNHISLSSPVLFVSSMFWLLAAPQPWFYFVLFTVIYIFVELKAWLIYRKMNWNKVVKLANKRKVFAVDENDPHLFEYRVVAMDADEQGYKKTWLDKFMDLWVLGLAFLVAPIGQLTVFTTPYRNYDVAMFVVSIMWIVLCIALNKHILGMYINLKLIRMKERGEF
jgi:hypothetical protein